MKKSFYLAAAAITLASCANEDYFGEEQVLPQAESTPVSFSSFSKKTTRAGEFTGSEAAAKLNNTFYVSGVKGATTMGDVNVFDNYTVTYTDNTANTTASNTKNWEYVAVTPNTHATNNGITQQAIKYWDYSKAQYDFIAYAAGEGITLDFDDTPTMPTVAGHLAVTEINPATAVSADGTTGAYKVAGTATDLAKFYISDLKTIKKADYNHEVALVFRSLGTKVRLGIYETVPGYSVKDVKFYTAAANDLAGDATDNSATIFTTTANQIYTKGTYTVYYPTVNDPANTDNNQAHIKFVADAGQETKVGFGELAYTYRESGEGSADAVYLGRTSNSVSFAGDEATNYYFDYIPNEAGTTLNLRVDYTLESIDGTKEEIVVRGATAQVPVNYTQWKAGYAYTYIFKISDKTNGHTGAYNPLDPNFDYGDADPVGLYPITFDAIVVNEEEDNTQETITTIAKPSITTYQKDSKVVSNNEYDEVSPAEAIYVDVVDYSGTAADAINSAAVVEIAGIGIDADKKAQVYELTKTASSTATLTEACVIDALNIQEVSKAGTADITGRNGLELTAIDPAAEITTAIPYADGNTINMTVGNAVKFAPATGTTYAFVYATKANTVAAADAANYEATPVAADASVKDLYKGTYAAGSGDAQKGVKYFQAGPDAEHPVVPATPYIGTGVSKMYVEVSAGIYELATGFAKTGTTYYTTKDNGQTYVNVKQMTYAAFLAATDVYSDAACTVAKAADVAPGTTAWYWKDDSDNVFPVVVEPQQVNTLLVVDETTKVKCADGELATDGVIYYDLYNKFNGEYAVKVIKVQ